MDAGVILGSSAAVPLSETGSWSHVPMSTLCDDIPDISKWDRVYATEPFCAPKRAMLTVAAPNIPINRFAPRSPLNCALTTDAM